MKTFLSLFTATFAFTLLTGCGDSHALETATGSASHAAATFKPGHGLSLSEEARRFVGLETAEVTAAGETGVLAIPSSAVFRGAKGTFVYVANGDHFLRTPVVTNLSGTAGERSSIREGLYEGDVIVTRGVQALWLAELQAVNGGVGCADGH